MFENCFFDLLPEISEVPPVEKCEINHRGILYLCIRLAVNTIFRVIHKILRLFTQFVDRRVQKRVVTGKILGYHLV